MSLESALVLAVVAGVVAWQACAALARPRCAITVQKTVNVNDQPEVVTLQVSRWRSSPARVWMDIERLGLAATARMTSINQDILDEVTKHSNKIAAQQAERSKLREELVLKRTRKKVARLHGISPKDVTDQMLAEARLKADTQRNGAPLEPVG